MGATHERVRHESIVPCPIGTTVTGMAFRGGAAGGLVARDSRQWVLLAVDGALGIVVGIVALFLPGLAILTVAFLLGLGLLVQGVLQIVAALRAGTGATGRGWLLAFGVLALVAGVLVVFNPGSGILVLVYGLILWFVVAGVHDLLAVSAGEHRVWSLVLGILSLVVAFVLLVSPATAVGVLALFVALGFLLRGGAELGLALSLRRLAR